MLSTARNSIIAWAVALVAGLYTTQTQAQIHQRSNVPPTMEIEVLDPNADPLGRPAVELRRDRDGVLQVDIPPVVLVHRYYYTGDRKFQAQLLPGGPSIVAVSHPCTGERCYIDVNMPPGAPLVTYCDRSIEYDFGRVAVTLKFALCGQPVIKYRNGPTVGERVANVLHVEQIKEHADETYDHLSTSVSRGKDMTCGAASKVCTMADTVLLPVKNSLQLIPFGKVMFSGDLGEELVVEAERHRREAEVKRFERDRRYEELSLPTIR